MVQNETSRKSQSASNFPSSMQNEHSKYSNSQNTGSGYRRHPFHKSEWGPYPVISISKSEKNRIRERLLKEAEETEANANQAEVVSSFDDLPPPPPRYKESAGHISIREVLARVNRAQPEHLYHRCVPTGLPLVIRFLGSAKFSLTWEVITFFNVVTSLILISYLASYSFYDKPVWDTVFICDVIFELDVILRLGVEIWRHRNRATIIVFQSPYTLTQFILDLLSMLPLHQYYYWIQGSSEISGLAKIGYFRWNKILRLSRCYKFLQSLKKQRTVNARLLFLFKFLIIYLGFIYITGCVFLRFTGVGPLDYLLLRKMRKLDRTYVGYFQKKQEEYPSTSWNIFVLSQYFATALITTVGYGDVIPQNEQEMAICIVSMLVGAIFLNGLYTSEMTSFEVGLDGARFDLFYRLKQIHANLASLSTKPFFNKRVDDYYNCLWTYREGVFDVPFLSRLTPNFHEALLFDICEEMFEKSEFFRNLDVAFLRAISRITKVTLYNPNMILCQEGKHASRMFYILQGECHVMSKLNPSNPSAILRPGAIIGEINLIFSYPYMTSVETKTCCQLLVITKRRLFDVAGKFRMELETMRSRCRQKVDELHERHQAYGIDPVCWVKHKTDLENPGYPNAEKLGKKMRLGTGLNREIFEDIVDDSQVTVIFETPCTNPQIRKNHLTTYMNSVVPEILYSGGHWIKRWNYLIIFVAMWFAFVGPYCLIFGVSIKLEHYFCEVQHHFTKIITFLFIVDFFVEIMGACPVSGLYYKFWDGLEVTRHSPSFYLDLLSGLPIDIWVFHPDDQHICAVLGTIFKLLKLWKVIRFLHYLDNVYPLKVFWLRLAQTIIAALYGIHFMACIYYHLACPFDAEVGAPHCRKKSWLSSYEIRCNLPN